MEDLISRVITEYGSQIWLTFITLVVTGFIMVIIRDFIKDLVYYFTVRFSDVGPDVMVYINGELCRVIEIKFKYLEIDNNKKKMRVPLDIWLSGIQIRPKIQKDAFDESQYGDWNGEDRRQ